MDNELKEEIDSRDVSVYMDDIIIHMNRTLEDHMCYIERLLLKLQHLGLFLKPEKCQFHQEQVEYLGMIVGSGTIRMDPVKIQGIILWLVPTNLKELRSFLGFCNFYRAFIKNFLKRARPLNDLTCKGCPFVWS